MTFLFLVLDILMIILIILAVILLALLAVPFQYDGEGCVNDSFYGKAWIKWLFGLVKFTVIKEGINDKLKVKTTLCGISFSFNPVKYNKGEKPGKKHEKKKEKDKKQYEKRSFTKKCIKTCINYCRDIIRIIKPKYVGINGVYGFEDPSLTGFLCGFISMINEIIPGSIINIQPVFDDSDMDINFRVYGNLSLGLITFRTLRFIIRKEIRSVIFRKKVKKVKPLKAKECIN